MGKTCLGKTCLKRKWLEHIWRQNYSFVPDDVFYFDGCYWFRLSLFNFEYDSALNYSFEMNVVREMKGCGDMSIAIGKRNNFARKQQYQMVTTLSANSIRRDSTPRTRQLDHRSGCLRKDSICVQSGSNTFVGKAIHQFINFTERLHCPLRHILVLF